MWKVAAGLLLACVVLVFATPAQAVECDGTALSDGCLFTSTGCDTLDPDDGFPVTNGGGIPFWDCYRTLDVQAVGHAISQRFMFDGFILQAFQKVILQYRPERAGQTACGPFDYLNTLDLLHDRFGGLSLPFLPEHQVMPEDTDAQGNPKPWAQIKQNHLQLVAEHPNFKEKFDDGKNPNWLNLYGLPISYEMYLDGDGKPLVEALRAQRANFLWWFQQAPGAPFGTVDQQNAPDEVKLRHGDVIIPDWAKLPVPLALAESEVPAPRRMLATGLTGYGIQGEFRREDDATLAQLVVNAGLGWVKQQIPWEEIENQAGLYYWDVTDQLVDTMRSYGLSILVSVIRAPDFYKLPELAGTHRGPPVDPTKFRDFMRELASRYRGKIQAYELWNEANLMREWSTLSPSSHLELLELIKQGYIGVKEGDPDAVVVLGALTPTGDTPTGIDDARYLERLFSANDGEIRNYFEALGVHPNGGPNAPDDTLEGAALGQGHSFETCGGGWISHGSFFFDRYEELWGIMQRTGMTDKTIWLTEFGWASIDAPDAPAGPAPAYEYAACNTEQDQAKWTARAIEKVRAEAPYVTHVFLWNLNFQQVVGPEDEKWAFGILRSDLSPRPAYEALRAVDKSPPSPAG